MSERIKVLSGRKRDPYESYEWMDELHRQHGLKPVYFFHVGQKRGRYDKNISTRNKAFRQLLRQHAEKYAIGIHPSWQSGDEAELLRKEKKVLEDVAQRTVTASRQHYIRFTLPQTYRRLIAAGITDDYSMGYGSVNGFRASVAAPFYWYDLEKEEQTNLLLHPFCCMDANSFFEQKFTPLQAYEEMMRYYETVRSVSGEMITVWHNSFLGTDPLFAGWKEVYERFVATVCSAPFSQPPGLPDTYRTA